MSKINETPDLPSGEAIVKYCAKYIANTLTDEQKTRLTRIFTSLQSNIINTNKEK